MSAGEKVICRWVLAGHMQVNTVNTHTHSYTPSTSCLCQHLRQTTWFRQPLPHLASPPTDNCIVFLFKTGGVCDRCHRQAEDMLLQRHGAFYVKWSHSLGPVLLLGSEGASCSFTHSVSPICQPPFSLSLSPLKLCHHEPAAHSLSHRPHVTGENLLHYQLIQKEL